MMNLGNILRWIAGSIIIAFLLFVLLSSCKSQNPVVIPQTTAHNHTSDTNSRKQTNDTVYIDRWHTRYTKGDTVYIHDSVYLFRASRSGDTLYINNSTHDTIPGEPVFVEKPGKAGSRFLRRSGVALWIIVGLCAIAMIIGIVLKFAK